MELVNEDDKNQQNAALIHEYGLKVDADFYMINGKPVLSLKGMKLLIANEKYRDELRKQAIAMGHDSEDFIIATETFIAKREARLQKKIEEMNLKPKDDGNISR